ncbi:MAG: SDR family oxidoreductase [Pseudomonadota bacterium]
MTKENATAIVTGFSSGLGLSLTKKLLAQSWNVIGVSRNSTELDIPNSDHLHIVTGSVADQEVVDKAFEIADGLGGATLLINSAGQGVFGEIGTYSAADIQTVLEGNLAGLIIFSDRAVNHMTNGNSNIVNIMSTAAKKYRAAESAYTAAKWGAKAYTRTLRDAIKSGKMGIRVFEIYPCGMATGFWNKSIRPPTDGASFPEPNSIADAILEAVFDEKPSYQQELTFERS